MLNHSNNKKIKLIEMLTKVDKSKYYKLYLASCYFTPEAAKNLINEINKSINILEINIYIDIKSALKIGKSELIKWNKKLNNKFQKQYGIDFTEVYFYAVEHSSLFHSKGYALTEIDEEGKYLMTSGSLVVGSANLTGNGLTSINGNIECLLDTQNTSVIAEFINSLENNLNWKWLSDIEYFEDPKSLSFMYAMLQEGEFIHPWSDNLNSLLTVKYKLSELGMERTKTDPAFLQRGFNMESLSVSKNYIDFNVADYLSDDFKKMKRNYGIECHLGHWIPKDLYEKFSGQVKGFEKFKSEFKSYFNNNNVLQISKIISEEYRALLRDGIIEKSVKKPQNMFSSKVKELVDSEVKLLRIFTKIENYDLPYDISDASNIKGLFEEITNFSNSKKRKNYGVRAWLAGVNSVSLTALNDEIPD
jgi:hypothetical protein